MLKTPNHHLLLVKGMSCQHCVKAVSQAIQEQDPKARVSVDLAQGRVSVETALALDAVIRAIAAEGYDVKPTAN